MKMTEYVMCGRSAEYLKLSNPAWGIVHCISPLEISLTVSNISEYVRTLCPGHFTPRCVPYRDSHSPKNVYTSFIQKLEPTQKSINSKTDKLWAVAVRMNEPQLHVMRKRIRNQKKSNIKQVKHTESIYI